MGLVGKLQRCSKNGPVSQGVIFGMVALTSLTLQQLRRFNQNRGHKKDTPLKGVSVGTNALQVIYM
jgi:hypothetical protein